MGECAGLSRALLPLFRETRASALRVLQMALRLSFRRGTSLSLSYC
jgi:hypothetical protein